MKGEKRVGREKLKRAKKAAREGGDGTGTWGMGYSWTKKSVWCVTAVKAPILAS